MGFNEWLTALLAAIALIMGVAITQMFGTSARIDALYTDVGTIKGTAGKIEANVEGLRRDVDAMKADIAAIRAAVNEIGKDSKEILKKRASLDEDLIAPEQSLPVATEQGTKSDVALDPAGVSGANAALKPGTPVVSTTGTKIGELIATGTTYIMLRSMLGGNDAVLWAPNSALTKSADTLVLNDVGFGKLTPYPPADAPLKRDRSSNSIPAHGASSPNSPSPQLPEPIPPPPPTVFPLPPK